MSNETQIGVDVRKIACCVTQGVMEGIIIAKTNKF